MEIDLPFVWAGIIAFAVLTYVILDGFDLGIGILFPFGGTTENRNVMMNSVAPVWDGNETWLILGGGGLFAVFPLAYSIVMPALYMPIILMLLALVFRGVAFEYRWRGPRWQGLWDSAFFGGSTVAAFMQGVALGALVQGIEIEGRAYAGGWWDWLSPFSVLTGVAVVAGYALSGSTWLIWRTTDRLQAQMRKVALPLGIVTMAAVGAVSLLTPFQNIEYFHRWFAFPGVFLTVLVPAALLVTSWVFFTGIRGVRDWVPFAMVQSLFVLCFLGLGVSFYPHIVPPGLTIAAAAAPPKSLLFALVGTVVLVPLILVYTAYAYWVFRGKVRPEDGYH